MRRLIGLGICAWIVLTALSAPLGPPSARADEDVAAFLLQQAKKAVSVRKYDEAVVKLRRAREEDPKLLEAAYLLGQVFEKMKKPADALGAYRAFRDGCRAQGDALDKKLARLLKRAEKRIATLGKGEKELEKLQAAFGAKLVGFATRLQRDDEDIAVDALERLLSVEPQHEAANRLLGELKGTSTDDGTIDPKASPIPGIERWDDLLARRAIPPGNNTSYKRKVLTIDNEGNTIFWTDPAKLAPEEFVYDMEFRFTKEHANGYLLGFAFAQDETVARRGGHEFVMAFAQKSLVTIVHASGGKNIDVGEAARKSSRLGTWHRLTVAIQGRKVRVFLDGKQVLNASVAGRKELSGRLGLFHQRCAAEIRMLRVGTKR